MRNGERAEAAAKQLVALLPQLMIGAKGLFGEAPQEPFPAGRPSPRQMAVMMSLAENGAASVSDLAARMNLTLTHASQIVGELAGSGLVDRREDENDRRRTIVSVSSNSRHLVDAVATNAARTLGAFCASLPKDEADQFIRQLALLVSFLSPAATTAKTGAAPKRKGVGEATTSV